MKIKQKAAGLMGVILLLAMLDSALFPQILRYLPSGGNSWQLSATLLRETVQDCKAESEHTQALRGAPVRENGAAAFTLRLRLLFDLLRPCIFLAILWPLFCAARARRERVTHKKLICYLQCTDLP